MQHSFVSLASYIARNPLMCELFCVFCLFCILYCVFCIVCICILCILYYLYLYFVYSVFWGLFCMQLRFVSLASLLCMQLTDVWMNVVFCNCTLLHSNWTNMQMAGDSSQSWKKNVLRILEEDKMALLHQNWPNVVCRLIDMLICI